MFYSLCLDFIRVELKKHSYSNIIHVNVFKIVSGAVCDLPPLYNRNIQTLNIVSQLK